MQQLGYLEINGQQIKVLMRLTKMRGGGGFNSIKLRTSGKLGKKITDEAEFFKNEPEKLSKLLEGKVVKC